MDSVNKMLIGRKSKGNAQAMNILFSFYFFNEFSLFLKF